MSFVSALTVCYMFTRFRSLLREGLMMSVALYSHKPKKFRFFQAVNGLQMWRAGASNKVYSV